MAVMRKSSRNCLMLVLVTYLALAARIVLSDEGNTESPTEAPTVHQCRSHIEAAIRTFITTKQEEPQSLITEQSQVEGSPHTEKTDDDASDDVDAQETLTEAEDDTVSQDADQSPTEADDTSSEEAEDVKGDEEEDDSRQTAAEGESEGESEKEGEPEDATEAKDEEGTDDEVTEAKEDTLDTKTGDTETGEDDDDVTEVVDELVAAIDDTEDVTETGQDATKEEAEVSGQEQDVSEKEEGSVTQDVDEEGDEEEGEETATKPQDQEATEADATQDDEDETEGDEEATKDDDDDEQKTEVEGESVDDDDESIAEGKLDDEETAETEEGETAEATDEQTEDKDEATDEQTEGKDEATETEAVPAEKTDQTDEEKDDTEERDQSEQEDDDTVAASTQADDASDGEPEADESQAEADTATEGEEEEEEEEEEEIVEYRSRDHLINILGLDDESMAKTIATEKSVQDTLKELKRMYEGAVKPMENLYKFKDISNRYVGDAELFSKPLILFIGPWSSGKSTLINYFLDTEDTKMALRTGAEPQSNGFTVLMYGETEQMMDGIEVAADWTFSSLQKFGQTFQSRLQGVKLPNNLLRKVTIVDTPGILENRKQQERIYPFNDACQWFIDRADIIYVVFDPTKLDMGLEMEALFDQLKGREAQVRIVLNKADSVKPQELMRVQSTLLWNLSPVLGSTEPPIIFVGTFWSRQYLPDSPSTLFDAQEAALLYDLRQTIDGRVENKISFTRRHAVRVRNHAKMVDCYLNTYYNHKTFFSNKKKVADEIIENPQNYHIYEGLSTLTNVSRYDLPDPDIYRDFFKVNPLYEFKLLASTCSYFKGCPLDKLDLAIAYDLPELMGKYRKLVGASSYHERR